MAIRIPIAERQVSPTTANVPMPRQPGVVRAAFGEQVYESNQNLGRTGMRISELLAKHIHEREQQKLDAHLAQLDTDFRKEIQGTLFDETPETIDVNGQKVQRPKGILTRSLEQAEGATEEFDKKYRDIRQKYLSQAITTDGQARISGQMDQHYLTARQMTIRHEAAQGKVAMISRQSGNLHQQISDAAGIQDVQLLNVAIDRAQQTQDQINVLSGFDPETSEYKRTAVAGQLAAKPILATLKTTGDAQKALALLEGVKDKLSEESYADLQSRIKTGVKNMAEQAKRLEAEQKINNRFDYLTRVANGEIDWANAEEEVRSIAAHDPDLAEAINRYVRSDGQYTPTHLNDVYYMDMVKSVLSSNNQQEISEFLIKSLRGQGAGDISRDRLAILVGVAKERGAAIYGSLEAQDIIKSLKAVADLYQTSDVLPMTAMYSEFLAKKHRRQASGQDVKMIGNAVLRNAAIERYPAIGNMPAVPNKVIGEDGSLETIYDSLNQIMIDDDEPATSDQSQE